jgi:hypothetical protein
MPAHALIMSALSVKGRIVYLLQAWGLVGLALASWDVAHSCGASQVWGKWSSVSQEEEEG